MTRFQSPSLALYPRSRRISLCRKPRPCKIAGLSPKKYTNVRCCSSCPPKPPTLLRLRCKTSDARAGPETAWIWQEQRCRAGQDPAREEVHRCGGPRHPKLLHWDMRGTYVSAVKTATSSSLCFMLVLVGHWWNKDGPMFMDALVVQGKK